MEKPAGNPGEPPPTPPSMSGGVTSTHPTRNVFVYGTLMFPRVLLKLLGRAPPAQAAVLKGHDRMKIIGQHYPALIKVSDSDKCVRGLVLTVTLDEVEILDEYEDDEYESVQIEARLVRVGDPFAFATAEDTEWGDLDIDNCATASVSTYMWRISEFGHLLERECWGPNDFAPHESNFLHTNLA